MFGGRLIHAADYTGASRAIDAERREDERGGDAHGLALESARRRLADQHDGHVGEQHAERGAEHRRRQRVEAGREHHRRDLRLVADLGQEEHDRGDAEHTPARRSGGGSPSSSVSGFNAHSATAKNDSATAQRSTSGGNAVRPKLPSQPASAWLASVAARMPAMIGSGFSEPRRQHEREELRLVADLAQRDHAHRYEEGFHGNRRQDPMFAGRGLARRPPVGRGGAAGGRGCPPGRPPRRRAGRIIAASRLCPGEPSGATRDPMGWGELHSMD